MACRENSHSHHPVFAKTPCFWARHLEINPYLSRPLSAMQIFALAGACVGNVEVLRRLQQEAFAPCLGRWRRTLCLQECHEVWPDVGLQLHWWVDGDGIQTLPSVSWAAPLTTLAHQEATEDELRLICIEAGRQTDRQTDRQTNTHTHTQRTPNRSWHSSWRPGCRALTKSCKKNS